ncbi:uncharacterized protein BDZ99DRAFT_516576 [Mytilinidion resinicola]|uniref:Uncharacterized protein n=1 Tax=Mytilinidion resinicola TaxID=574789 RepID=A0A6A6YZN0_9PEZI|nr:uncharacterized protein BDZ99DRAFT_516576 [Mytilinidion resinicola]KAF2813949.1 hypothetical protein BDZ99DRAFT_516576 [Mytilinidion resinicola]
MATPIDLLSAEIALLSLVNDLPKQPSINVSSQYIKEQGSQPSRTLSFKHEISITPNLAFICAYSDDPLHVLAACIEEAILRDCLIIRFAANTGKHGVLVDGLKAIPRILQNEERYRRSSTFEKRLQGLVKGIHSIF